MSSGKAILLSAVVVAAALTAGILAVTKQDPPEEKPLTAPSHACWGGMIDRGLFQKLLGPGKELRMRPGEVFRADSDHDPSYCAYEAVGDEVDDVLQANVYWLEKDPSQELLPPGSGVKGENLEYLNIGSLGYYVGDWNRVYFECDVQHPPGTSASIKADRFLGVNLVAKPMQSTNLSALEARQVSIDILVDLAKGVADKVGCTNGTELPTKPPRVTKANWPRF